MESLLLEEEQSPNSRPSIKMSISSLLYKMSYTLGPIGMASVLIWVGLWGLLDEYLIPTDKTLSALATLSMAFMLTFLIHLLYDSHNQAWWYPILAASLGVCYWRSVWHLWEVWVLPNHPPLQSALALGLGSLLLIATGHCRNNVVGPPILILPVPNNFFKQASLPPTKTEEDWDAYRIEEQQPLEDDGEGDVAMTSLTNNNEASE